MKHKKEIVFRLLELSEKKLNKNNFKLDLSVCKEHYLYMIKLLFRTVIFKKCKWTNTELHNKAVQQIAKLKVLQHN